MTGTRAYEKCNTDERQRRLALIRKLDLPLDAIMARFGVSNAEAIRLRREAKA